MTIWRRFVSGAPLVPLGHQVHYSQADTTPDKADVRYLLRMSGAVAMVAYLCLQASYSLSFFLPISLTAPSSQL